MDTNRDDGQTESETVSLGSHFAEIAAVVAELQSGWKAAAEQFSEQWKTILQNLPALRAAAAAEAAEHDQAVAKLAHKGWTIPGWFNLEDVHELSRIENLDPAMVALYCEGEP